MISGLWFLFLLATVLFVGKIVTFSFLVAPSIHSQLKKEDAAQVLRVLFPRYYKLGAFSALLGLTSGLIIAYATPVTWMKYAEALWTFVLLIELYALLVLLPRLNAARDGRNQGNAEATTAWESCHKLSVRLNILNLVLGLILIWLFT
jgi:uncharacterized membrane protein